jgi:hypothetical protein
MSRSFVLSGLQPFLHIGQNRVEMRLSRQILREKRPETCGKDALGELADTQFWPRIEMPRLFVLSELQPFLYVGLCRIEMQRRSSKLRA